MRLCAWSIGAILAVVLGLTLAAPAAGLPASPWSGRWLDGSGDLLTLGQSGTQITGTGPCPGGGSTAPDVSYTGTTSADGATANFTYSSVVCTGTGGTFTGTLSPDGLRVSGTGTTQFGTGFAFGWTYQGGGTEPRSTPTPPPPPPVPARAPCPGGPWSGLWSTADGGRFSLLQGGTSFSGVIVDAPVTHTGKVSGDTVRGTFRRPEGRGTLELKMAPDGRSFRYEGTTTTGAPDRGFTSTFLGCATGPSAVDLSRTIPAPQTMAAGPTTLVAPGTVSIVALRRSRCVLVRASSRRPARVLVSIFSGRRSIRLFGQRLVVFRVRGARQVCIRVPFRAHTFDVRTRLRVALGYAVGARERRGERPPPPVIRPIRLVP